MTSGVSQIACQAVLWQGQLVLNQCLTIKDGSIDAIADYSPLHHKVALLTGTLVPGYIDLQVNGGGDILFNQQPKPEALLHIAMAHRQFGTCYWLPTLVTDSLQVMRQAADAVAELRLTDQAGLTDSGVLGIHFEGPHISIEKKGVHSEQYIRSVSEAEMTLYCRKDLGQVMVTLAPECVSDQVIAELTGQGVIVFLGHSNASFEQTCRAVNAGAKGFTHLYNAMSGFGSRQPGMVGAALALTHMAYGMILDGVHLHPQTVKTTYQLNPNMLLVTDAMPLVGSTKTQFNFFGETIKRQGGQLCNSKQQLAGSLLDMQTAVSNASRLLDLSLVEAVAAATSRPAELLGVNDQVGVLDLNRKASLLLLDEKGKLISGWFEGKPFSVKV